MQILMLAHAHFVSFAELPDLCDVISGEGGRLVLAQLSNVVGDEEGAEGATRVSVLLSRHAPIHSNHLNAIAWLALVNQVVVRNDVH